MDNMPNSLERKPKATSTSAARSQVSSRSSQQQSNDNDVIDLVSSGDDNNVKSNDNVESNDNVKSNDNNSKSQKSSSSSSSSDDDTDEVVAEVVNNNGDDDDTTRTLNDTKLIGTHKLITLESAAQSINLVAEFVRDEEAGKSVTFARSFFIPLWERLKDQGSCSSSSNNNNSTDNSNDSNINKNNCCWKYESSRNPLSRNTVFVPPTSKLGARGTCGKDYYVSEEHVAFDVLENISTTLEEVDELLSESFARNAQYFTILLSILDRAVRDDTEYKYARRRERSASLNGNNSGGSISNSVNSSGTPNKKRKTYGSRRSSSGSGGRTDRSYNYSSFGLEDYAPCDYSGGEKSSSGEEKRNDPDGEDGNQDECAICGDGGELICCDNCDKAYHATCLQVEPKSLPDPWHCPSCVCDDNNGNKKMAHIPDQQNVKETASDSAILQHNDDAMPSNLLGVELKVEMPIEILDPDNIWNMGQIVDISYENDKGQTKAKGEQNSEPNAPSPKCHITVRYEGWGKDWDETLPYPNSRLARIFTYTKKVKCFVVLFDPPRTTADLVQARNNNNDYVANWTDVWPCTATFRMPHPDQNETSEALKCLREDNTQIFVHPHLTDLLPKSVQRQMMHEGKWVSEKRLRPWKDLDLKNPKASPAGNPILYELLSTGRRVGEEASASSTVDNMAYYFVQNFSKAYQAAQSNWIRGYLPSNALLGGALLKDEYRVSNVGGDVVGGVKYSGSFPTKEGERQFRSCSIPSFLAVGAMQSSLKSASDVVDLTKLDDSDHDLPASKVLFVPAPFLPPPIPIKDVAYPGQGVRRLPDSNRWAAILRGPGNEIFLGSYTSQTEAAYAVKLASAQSKSENSPNVVGSTKESGGPIKNTLHLPHFPNFQEESPFGSNAGRIADLMNTPIESIVSAFEDTQQLTSNQKQSTQPRFRLRDWMAQHHRHVQHLKDLSPMSGQDVRDNFPLIVNVKDSGSGSRKRRKQSAPKRLQTSTTAGKQNNCY